MRKLYTILISLLSIAGILVLVYVIYIVIEKKNNKSGEQSKPEKEGPKKNPTFKLPREEKFDIPVEGSEFEKEHREPRENIWAGFREPYRPLLEKGITGERWNKGVPRFRTEYGYSHPRTKEEEKEMLREMSLNEERITEEERLLNEQRKIEESKINEIKRAFEKEKETFKEENTVIKQKLELEAKRQEEANIKLEEEWKRLDTEKRILENEKRIEEEMLVKKRNQLEEQRRIVEEEVKIREEKLSEMKDLINEIKRLEEDEEHEAEKKRLETIRNEERHYVYKTHEEPAKSLHTSPVFVKRERLGRLLRSVGRDVSAQKEHSPMSGKVNELIRQNRLLEEQIKKEKEKIYPSFSEETRSLYMPGRAEVPSRHSKERQMMEEGSLSTILEEESTKQEKEPALQTEDPKISKKVCGEIPAVSKPEEPVSIVYESPIQVETKTVTETTPTLPSERTTSTTEKEPTQKPLTKKATITSVDESLIPLQDIPPVKHEKAVKTTVPQIESKEASIQEVKTKESTGKRKLEPSSSPSKFQRRNISGDVEGSYTFKIPVRREFESVETKTKLANPSEVAEMSELPAEQASKQEVLIPEQAGMIVNPEQEKEILESESKFLPSHSKKQIKSKVNALEEEQEIEQRKEIPASLTEKTSSLSKNYEFIPSLKEIEAETQKEEQQPPLLQVENVERTINVPREVIKVEPSEVNREMFEFIPILKEIETEAQKEEQQQLPVSHVENVEKTIYVPNETINVPSEEPLKESFVYPSFYEKSFQQPLVSEKQKIYSRNPEEKKTKLALEKGYSSDPEEFLKERESEVQPKRLVRRQSFGETPHIMSKLRRNIKKEEKVPITESTPLIEEESALQQTKPPVTEVIEVNQPAQIQVEDYEQWFARSREKGFKEKLPVEEKPFQQTAQQSSEISEGEEGTFITKKRRMSPVYSSSEEEGTQSTRERSRSPLYSSSQRELLFDEEQARMQKEKLNKAKLRSKKIRKELKERRSKKSESEMTEENVPVKETEV